MYIQTVLSEAEVRGILGVHDPSLSICPAYVTGPSHPGSLEYYGIVCPIPNLSNHFSTANLMPFTT